MRRKKRLKITLLEVMIALFLVAILFSVLFGKLCYLVRFHSKLEKARDEVMQNKYLQEKLSILFSTQLPTDNLVNLSQKAKFLLPSSDSLIFSYKNDLDPDPNFTGLVQGTLYLQNREILLETKGKNNKKRLEVLKKDVEEFRILLFDIFKAKGNWVSHWQEKAFPPMIRLDIVLKPKSTIDANSKRSNLSFVFFTCQEDNMIIFDKPIIAPPQ